MNAEEEVTLLQTLESRNYARVCSSTDLGFKEVNEFVFRSSIYTAPIKKLHHLHRLFLGTQCAQFDK